MRLINKQAAAVSCICLLLLSVSLTRADSRPGSLYLNPILAHWMTYQAPNSLQNGTIWGARLGLGLSPNLSLEGSACGG